MCPSAFPCSIPPELSAVSSNAIDAQELLQAVPAVFQSANHVEEQPDLSVRHGFSGRKPPVFKSSACRRQREIGGLRSGILAL